MKWSVFRSCPVNPDVITPMPKKTKTCKGCDTQLPKGDFVSRFGFTNPRGHLCKNCWNEKQQDEVRDLMDGRDACLYCGVSQQKVRDYDENGNVTKTYLHMDHMEPIARGGYDPYTYDMEINDFTDDTTRNTVYCCTDCNLRKSDLPFVEWLDKIPEIHRGFARKVYRERNGIEPEEFVPQSDFEITIIVDDGSPVEPA